MKFKESLQYISLVSIIIATVSIGYLGITRVGYFYKYHLAEYYQKVVLTKAFLFPLSFFVLALLAALLDLCLTKKQK